ncbi:hypothetical protein GCM10008967_37730 [Bacillus carboniphilus]|uniref:Lipoprotein n=1 Tax=Bacillus carboniphilus TaxID=86663 RepID=A0ABN0WPW5_9BACI
MSKSRALFLLVAILIITITGCTKNNMPNEMPDDFAFLVKFGVGSKNEINTFDQTVTKDLIMDGTVTENIPLTKEELQDIYEKMKKVNVLEPKQLEPKKVRCMQDPHGNDHWKIKLNGETIIFHVSEVYCKPTKDAKELMELRDYIFDIVSKKDQYKMLPEANGGYK